MLRVAGLAGLHPDDQELLRAHAAEIKARLAGPADDADPCEEWGVEVRLVTDAAAAEAIVAGLPAGVGVDIETAPRPGFEAAEQPWLKITRKGAPYKVSPGNGDKIGLDPYRAEPRTVQVYDPARAGCTCSICAACRWRRSPVCGNAGWSRTTPPSSWRCWRAWASTRTDVIDSMQLVGLRLGCAPGRASSRMPTQSCSAPRCPRAAESAWGAERLSLEQVRYAAADAAAAHMISRASLATPGDVRARGLLAVQRRRADRSRDADRGCPFDVAVHHERIATWETALAAARRSFVELTGDEVPKLGPQRRAWLEQRLPEEELARWPRTMAGHLSTKADDMARLADRPEIAALLKVDAEDKKLRDFGRKLVDLVNPGTLRLHPSWMPCGAKTGRFACSNPNMQQLPKKERHAVIAPPGAFGHYC